METHTGADAFVEVLIASGVERVYHNPGIDTVPVLEALSKRRESGGDAPDAVLCPHEAVAMTAAQGDFMVSGRPQIVLVHSELGTQQVGGALHNAQWGRIPVVLCAGLSNTAGRLDWQRNRFDQARSVRNCVKWDHELKDGENLSAVLTEALRMATAEPCGPVYLTFPMDVLNLDTPSVAPPPAQHSQQRADAGALNRAAGILVSAENPLIVTGYSGRNLDCVASLVELAETVSAPVVSADTRMNFPTTHPLFTCREPVAGRRGIPYLDTADVVLVIDYDIPYASPRIGPRHDARIIHIDIDIEKRGLPLWDRHPDVAVQADSSQAIPLLMDGIRQRMTPSHHPKLKDRSARLQSEHDRLMREWRSIATKASGQVPISSDWLCRCVGEAIDDDTILLTQALRAGASLPHQVDRTRPGTLLASAGGTMGWALPAALGARIAAPDRTVVALMGDGVFVYGSPVATLWCARRYRAPFLSVIFNNQGYEAIRGLFRRRPEVPEQSADIMPPPDYAMIARGCGAYGRTVEDPADVLPALREGIDRVRNGQAAVLDIRVEKS
jgi:acetolactate synthase-1/2/3 large subunit